MRRRIAADCDVANPGNADDLPAVVDRGGGTGRVVAHQWKRTRCPSARPPDHRFELQLLRRDTGVVHHGVFRPADDFAEVVRPGREAVGAAG